MRTLYFTLVACLIGSVAYAGPEVEMNLAGSWEFRLDPQDVGTTSGWTNAALPDQIPLPGSTDIAGKGNLPEEHRFDRLSRVHPYAGKAWYSKVVNVPEGWRDKRIVLYLERCHWITSVWVDGKAAGFFDSLCVPHVYDLTKFASPGQHRITVCVDNSERLLEIVGHWAHSVTDETQTNWNGIIGKIELRATPKVWIERAAFVPHPQTSDLGVTVTIGNVTGAEVSPLRVEFAGKTLLDKTVPVLEVDVAPGLHKFHTTLPISSKAQLWDEFSPKLHDLTISVSKPTVGHPFSSTESYKIGLREIRGAGKRIEVNGKSVYLRGTLDCCIYPKTAFPPTDLAWWKHELGIARSYGLNHIRFHSWCPPEAAFQAADEMGFMFQVESPIWQTDGLTAEKPERAKFFYEETDRIIDAYGNHPSFCLFSMGNELLFGRRGDEPFLTELVRHLKSRDQRHLYTCSSAPYGPRTDDDYFVAQQMGNEMIRGQRRIGIKDTSTDFDWDKPLEETTRPVIAHEIGQYAMLPYFPEMEEYTGPVKPRNFEMILDAMTSAAIRDQAMDLVRASGKLMVELYKDEIESHLRSRNSGGFALLDLHDFPGQGTALVGPLNAFWQSKGLVTPEAYRRFCNAVVPLARLPKRVWDTSETLSAWFEVRNDGPADLPAQKLYYTLQSEQGHKGVGFALDFSSQGVARGEVKRIGQFEWPLEKAEIKEPTKLKLTARFGKAANDWNIWVYPPVSDPPLGDLVISHKWDSDTTAAIAAGKKVLFFAPWKEMGNAIPGRFVTVFWNARMFPQPATMGMFCDAKHPALAKFPTEDHGDWQWLEILNGSGALILEDSTPASFLPIVQPVPDINTIHKLGTLFEAKVGKGNLFVCAADLENDLNARPSARQLRHSVLSYLTSSRFAPKAELTLSQLDKLFQPPRIRELITSAPDPKTATFAVRAGTHGEMEKSLPWKKSLDEVVASKPGFGYKIGRARVWRDAEGSAWTGDRVEMTISVPKGFSGRLFVHLHDWNAQDRAARVNFEQQDLGLVQKYDGKGVWLALPFTQETSDGQLDLRIFSEAGPNAMVTDFAIVP